MKFKVTHFKYTSAGVDEGRMTMPRVAEVSVTIDGDERELLQLCKDITDSYNKDDDAAADLQLDLATVLAEEDFIPNSIYTFSILNVTVKAVLMKYDNGMATFAVYEIRHESIGSFSKYDYVKKDGIKAR